MREATAVRAQAVRAVGDEIHAEIRGKTLLTAFADTIGRLGDAEALRWKGDDGEWRSLTWLEYGIGVREVALGLLACGLRRGECALLWSRIRHEPHIAELGVLDAGGIPVHLYTTLAPEQVTFVARHCEATVAFVENREFLPTLLALKPQLPDLRLVVLLEGRGPGDDEWLMTWDELRAAGRAYALHGPRAVEDARHRVGPNDLATIIYTSGTTGAPKGVMITHGCVLWNVTSFNRVIPPSPNARQISYLPMAHATGRFLSQWTPVVNGGTVSLCPDVSQVFDMAREVRPTAFAGVPRIWEKLHAALTVAIDADPDPIHRRLVARALDAGRTVSRLRQRGEPVPSDLEQEAGRTASIRRDILRRVGLEDCEMAVTGAAPLDPRIVEFFQALGLPLTEGWGMTELTGAVTVTALDRIRTGTVGYAMPGVELKVAADGELLVRCGCVTPGYYRDPDLTAETSDADGWLHTGDVGTVDADGYVRIVDRKKELIITSGGKNISPAAIEGRLMRHPLVSQACAIGDRRKCVTALLVLDAEMASIWARRRGVEGASLSELIAEPALLAEIQRAVDAANGHLSRVEQVKRFRLLPVEWTAESGELTPTLKKRRRIIVERYAGEIEDMYAQLEATARPPAPR